MSTKYKIQIVTDLINTQCSKKVRHLKITKSFDALSIYKNVGKLFFKAEVLDVFIQK